MTERHFIEIDLGYSPIPNGCRRKIDEVTIKKDGHVWRIHKNDADPFPSNPHAHNAESGLKLCLSTGNLYFGRDNVRTMSKKNFLDFRIRVADMEINLPELKRG